MASIQERKTKNGETHYRVQIRIKGHPVVRATFESKTKAKQWAQKTEVEIKDGRYFKTAESRKHTLRDAIVRYERDVLSNKEGAKQDQQFRWWREKLGDYSLADITPALIAEYRDRLNQTTTRFGRKMRPTTVIRYLAALSHVFTVASTDWGWTEVQPLKRVSRPKVGQLRVRFLSGDELERLLRACKEDPCPYLYPVVVLALATGMRKSEIMTLTASSIDTSTGCIFLERTKNGERRRVPLKGHALALVQGLLWQKRQNLNYLFPSKNGQKPFDIRCAWERALKRAAIADFKFHDLRHSAASFLLASGASLAEIAEVLGHKTLSMVKRYAHLSESHTAGVVEKMNEKIFGDLCE